MTQGLSAREARRLLARHATHVAPRLLNAIIRVDSADGVVAVRITEVEAYGGVDEDPGSHAYRGPTRRNATMFASAGSLYTYFVYGMHWCANVVTGAVGEAGAVLLRAGEIVEGVSVARSRRSSARSDRDLARGPARLARSLGWDGSADGIDLLGGSGVTLTLLGGPVPSHIVTPRTGVAGHGAATPWRFALDDPTVSPYRPAAARGGRGSAGSHGRS